MMTIEERKEGFAKELKELLKKYNAEINLEDFGRDYSRDDKIVIDFDWTESGGYGQLILGSHFS